MKANPTIERLSTLAPKARVKFLEALPVSEISALAADVLGEAWKPKTPRPVAVKKILLSFEAAAAPKAKPGKRVPASDGPPAEPAVKKPAKPAAPPAPAPAKRGYEGDPAAEGIAAARQDARAARHTPATVAPAARTPADAAAAPVEGATADTAPRVRSLPPVGARIQKLGRGGTVRAECEVVEGGVLYAGKRYTSLSAAAMAAASDIGLGAKALNGWAWWGLIDAPRPSKQVDVGARLEKRFAAYLQAARAAAATAEGRAVVETQLEALKDL